MQTAFSYRITYSNNCYSIYINNILSGKLIKKVWYRFPVFIELRGQQYYLKRTGLFNPSILLTEAENNTFVGKMKIFNFARLFPKAIFENNEKQKTIWVIKNIFSLHWQWNKNETAIIETIENIDLGRQEGVILVTDNSEDTDLLIIIGLYLRNYMRRLSLHKFSPGK